MVGRIVRKIGEFVYKHPETLEDVSRPSKFGSLKIALLADYFTTECLSMECRIRALTPANYREVIGVWKPDLVFVESVFHGAGGAWRYEVAKQSKLLRLTKPTAIYRLVGFARSCGVPTVFWNKDDGAFFDTFIDVAKAFDYVFTTDQDCLPKYRAQVPESVPVNTLVMPFQPAFHSFDGFRFVRNEACFTGSYYRKILNERARFLDAMFGACEDADLRLNVYDRNHDRLSRHFEFRFPKRSHVTVHGKVSHRETARVYKEHALSINVNSVTGSETMFSRRLLEILACGSIAVTNPSRAIDKYFRDFCHVVTTREEARELFMRLKSGPSRNDLEKAEAGAMYVKSAHTWEHRLEEICEIANI